MACALRRQNLFRVDVPQNLQVLDEDEDIYNDADYFLEAADWIVWQLTGRQTRNACTAGYKAIWNKQDGYPSKAFFKALDARLENVVEEKLNCEILPIGAKAGEITPEAASLTAVSYTHLEPGDHQRDFEQPNHQRTERAYQNYPFARPFFHLRTEIRSAQPY